MSITNEQMEKAHETIDNVVQLGPRLAYSGGGSGSWDWLRSLDQGWIFLARPRADHPRLGLKTSRLTEFEVLYRDKGHPLAYLGYLGERHWHWTPDFSQEFEMLLARKGDDTDNTSDDGGHVPPA